MVGRGLLRNFFSTSRLLATAVFLVLFSFTMEEARCSDDERVGKAQTAHSSLVTSPDPSSRSLVPGVRRASLPTITVFSDLKKTDHLNSTPPPSSDAPESKSQGNTPHTTHRNLSAGGQKSTQTSPSPPGRQIMSTLGEDSQESYTIIVDPPQNGSLETSVDQKEQPEEKKFWNIWGNKKREQTPKVLRKTSSPFSDAAYLTALDGEVEWGKEDIEVDTLNSVSPAAQKSWRCCCCCQKKDLLLDEENEKSTQSSWWCWGRKKAATPPKSPEEADTYQPIKSTTGTPCLPHREITPQGAVRQIDGFRQLPVDPKGLPELL